MLNYYNAQLRDCTKGIFQDTKPRKITNKQERIHKISWQSD